MATFLSRDQYTKFSGENLLAGLRHDFESALNPQVTMPEDVSQPIARTIPTSALIPQSTVTDQFNADYGLNGDYTQTIRDSATRYGVDPEIALQVADSEGGRKAGASGDQNSSFSPFMLHYGNVAAGGNAVAGLGDEFTRQTGLDARDPKNTAQAIDFALKHASTNGWGAFHGAARVGIGEREGIGTKVDSIISGRTPLPQTPGDWFSLAKQQLGKPYEWGSAGGRTNFGDATGFDCSGFVSYVYKNALGVNLPAQTSTAYAATKAVSVDQAKPGDVVLYNMDSNDPHVQHIAIYIGDGRVIQAGGGVDKNVNIAPIGQAGSYEFRRADGADTSKANVTAGNVVASKLDEPKRDIIGDLRSGFESKLADAGKAKDDVLAKLRDGFDTAMGDIGQGVLTNGETNRGIVSTVGGAATAAAQGLSDVTGQALLDQGEQDRQALQTTREFTAANVFPYISKEEYGGRHVPDYAHMTREELVAEAPSVGGMVGVVGSAGTVGKAASHGEQLLDDALKMHAQQDAIKLPKIDPNDVGRSVERAISDKFADLNRLSPEVEEAVGNFQGRTGAAVMRADEAIQPALKVVGNDLPELNVYRKFQVDAERGTGSRQASAGVTSAADAKAALTALEDRVGPQRFAKIQQADQIVQKALDNLLDAKVATGMVKPEDAAFLKAKYPHYNPVKLMEAVEDGSMATGKRMSQNSNLIKRLTEQGSGKDTEQPVRSAIRALVENDVAIQRNEVAKTIAAQVESQGLGKRVSTVTLRTGPNVATGDIATVAQKKVGDIPGAISFWENGKRVAVSMPKDMEVAAKALADPALGGFSRVAMAANAPLRKGATTLNLLFIPKNAVADAITTFVREGFEATARIPLGYAQAAFKTKSYRALIKAGGGMEGYMTKNPATIEKAIAESGGTVIRHRDQWAKFVTQTINPLHYVEKVGGIVEQGPRIATFDTRIRRGQSVSTAALAARRVTVDFARSGSSIKVANAWVPFLNAQVQGTLQVGRTLRDSPAARWRLAGLSALVAATYANNRQHPEEYADIPDYIKDQYAVVILGPGKPNANGVGFESIPYVALPLRQWAAPAAALVQQLARADKADPRSFGQGIADIAKSFSPASGDSAISGIGGLMPAPARAALESAVNRKFFTDSPIVGQQLQDTPPSEQYDEHTGDWSKKIAATFGGSPKGVEHMLNALLGGVGTQIAQGSLDPTKGIVKDQGGQTLQHLYDRANSLVSQMQSPLDGLVRQSSEYQKATRDRQVDLQQAAHNALKDWANEQVGIPKIQTDTGLPQKYPGVAKRSARELEIDKAVSAYNAWHADPAHAKMPTGKEIALYAQYSRLVLPPYAQAKEKQTAETTKTKRLIERLPVVP